MRSEPAAVPPAGQSAERPGFVLVHSPLLGPASWTRVAAVLRRAGRPVAVPSLEPATTADAPRWQQAVELISAAAETLGGSVILAGHSGGGLLLPSASARLGPRAGGLVFVDSSLPEPGGRTPLIPPDFRRQLAGLARDGVLPAWSQWWGPDVMQTLVPDAALRTRLEREMPRVPLSWFDQVIDDPTGWEAVPCGYVLLSDAYREEAQAARAWGWPVVEIADAGHLHIAVDPDAVAGALLRLMT